VYMNQHHKETNGNQTNGSVFFLFTKRPCIWYNVTILDFFEGSTRCQMQPTN
jgi:hypothetical protein